jgi:two-component system, OmpR family, sensor kinase
MKRRLFWKLLIGAWLTLVLVAIGNGFLFHAVAKSGYSFGVKIQQRYDELELEAATQILQAQGPEALEAFLARLAGGQQMQVLRDGSGSEPAAAPQTSRSRRVHTSSGDFTLTLTGSSAFPRTPALLYQVPAHLLIVDFLALSLFSVVIAQYLAGPIRKLSTGMARVADGHLDARVADKVGGRRDELADLATTFDYMADRLQQLVRARERLLHDVSHEFRSPLTRIRLAADLARQNPERWPSSLERIVQDAERLSRMVEELLALSRAQFAPSKSETYFDLADLLSEVVADVRFEAQAANITLTVSVPENLRDRAELVLNGNPDLLRKAIENVLRNAVRYSRPGQSITLALSHLQGSPGTLQIEVADHGPGVPAEHLTRIFEPFERLEPSSNSSGFGLGLAIARSAALAHDGSIWATNRPEGGLIVTLRLPLPRVEASTHQLSHTPSHLAH